jgi:hypothetical protein
MNLIDFCLKYFINKKEVKEKMKVKKAKKGKDE